MLQQHWVRVRVSSLSLFPSLVVEKKERMWPPLKQSTAETTSGDGDGETDCAQSCCCTILPCTVLYSYRQWRRRRRKCCRFLSFFEVALDLLNQLQLRKNLTSKTRQTNKIRQLTVSNAQLSPPWRQMKQHSRQTDSLNLGDHSNERKSLSMKKSISSINQ